MTERERILSELLGEKAKIYGLVAELSLCRALQSEIML